LFRTPDLDNFAAASRSRCQQNSSSSTVEFADDTYTTIDESWLFTTSRSTVTSNCIRPTSISYGFVVQLVSAVDEILTDTTRCGLRQQSFLLAAANISVHCFSSIPGSYFQFHFLYGFYNNVTSSFTSVFPNSFSSENYCSLSSTFSVQLLLSVNEIITAVSSARLVLSRHLCAVHNVRQLRRRVGPTTANQLSDVLGLKANSRRHTRHDKTVAPTSRPPPRRRPGRLLRLAARPPTRSDVVRQENANTLWTVVYD